jgi:N-acetylneuraminate lyase
MKHYDLNKFKGIIIAMYACYDEKGNVSLDAVKKLARHYAQINGIKGLFVGGSTGEGILQSTEERKQVLTAVMEEVGKELTVIAHVGAPSTRESVELSIHAESVDADAIAAVPAIYYRFSPQSVENHWQAMIDSTSLPFFIYHIPQTTAFQLSTELLAKMATQEKVIGVKISSESTYELQQFKAAGGPDFIVLNGPDEQYLAGRSIGADGGIGGTYGVMPELFIKIEQCFVEGRIEEARKWQFRVNEIIHGLLSMPSLYGACKAILKLRGLEIGQPRMPIMSILETEMGPIIELNNKIMHYIELAKASPSRIEKVDKLNVRVYGNRQALGSAAGTDVSLRLKELLSQQEFVNIILGSAPSQNEFIQSLSEADSIDWSRVRVFHMDEYIGMSKNDQQAFSKYLQDRLVNKINLKQFYAIDGMADPYQECMRYSELLNEYPPDIVCLGIGENGHIAFNDPPVADFKDPLRVKVVEIDEPCRRQQVNDGCFPTIEDVPTTAITLTVPMLTAGIYMYCIVPGKLKAQAIKHTLHGEITTDCPATILRMHPSCTLYVDSDSYGALD